MVTIVLVDDHKILQSGLGRSIESTGEAKVVAYAESAKDGLFEVEKHKPDLGIFDLGLPDHSGLWLIRRVRSIRPQMPILVLSMHTELQIIKAVLQNGANGYLRKTADEDTLLNAVRTVMSGELFLEPQLASALKASGQTTGKSVSERYLDQAVDIVLTSKEIEILQLTSAGLNNQEMGEKLGVSISTIKARLRTIFGKLNVDSRTEAVTAALTLGLLTDYRSH